jgi:hypothetical protein
VSTDAEPRFFEQYKLAVEMADRISARRGATNTFFITANAALMTAVGSNRVADTAAVAGIALAVGWWVLLRSFRDLSAAKWQVITEMEKQLPARPFTDEWDCLKADPVSGWRPRYAELSSVERVGPIVFLGLFVIGLLGGLD